MAFTCNNLQMRNPLYLMKLILFQKSLNLIYISLFFDVNLLIKIFQLLRKYLARRRPTC